MKQNPFATQTETLTLLRMSAPVLIIIRRGEARAKCTIQPLRGTPGLTFMPYPLHQKPDVSKHLLLAPNAPVLTLADAGRPLLLLDANWHHAGKMRKAVEPVEARSIPSAWKTAYPRHSKIHADPDSGLATVEALFAAFCILRQRDDSLLRFYRWKDAFLELNRALCGPPPAKEADSMHSVSL